MEREVSSDNDSCCARASGTFSNYTMSFSINFTFYDIICLVKQQTFCSFVAKATLEDIGLCGER